MKQAIILPYSCDQNAPSRPVAKIFNIPDDIEERNDMLIELFTSYAVDIEDPDDIEDITITEGKEGNYGDIIVEWNEIYLFVTFIEQPVSMDLMKPINVDLQDYDAVKQFAQQLVEAQYDNAGIVVSVVVKCKGRELFIETVGGNPDLKYARHCFESYGWDCETIEDCGSMADILHYFGY